MFREDTTCVEKLLRPVKRILTQENSIKKESPERRILLWNEILENYNRYIDGDCGKFLKDMDSHFQSQFNAALLVLAITFSEKGEWFEPASIFSNEEIEAYKKIAQYNVFNIYTPSDMRKKLEIKDDEVLRLLSDYYYVMETWINSTLSNASMNLWIRFYIKKKWEEYRHTIDNAIKQDLDQWIHCISKYHTLQRADTHTTIAERESPAEQTKKEITTKPGEIVARTREHNKAGLGDEREKQISENQKTEKDLSPHLVFISYSNADRRIATSVCSYLESHGIGCWISPRDLVPGANYPSSIIEAIDRSRIVLLIYSKSSNKSPHVFRELEEALIKKVRILPFLIDNEPFSDDMKYFINIHHWLEAFTDLPEQHFNKLLRSIRSYTDEKSAP